MSHEYNDEGWEREVESVQRGGVTGEVHRKRHGETHRPSPANEDEDDQHEESEGCFDADGIPKGI